MFVNVAASPSGVRISVSCKHLHPTCRLSCRKSRCAHTDRAAWRMSNFALRIRSVWQLFGWANRKLFDVFIARIMSESVCAGVRVCECFTCLLMQYSSDCRRFFGPTRLHPFSSFSLPPNLSLLTTSSAVTRMSSWRGRRTLIAL